MDAQVYVAGSGECEQLGIPDCFIARRPRSLSLPQEVSMIACGALHTLALTSSGLIFSWGCNDEGALGRPGEENKPIHIDGLQPITQISAGDSHSVALAGHLKILYYWGTYRNREGTMTAVTHVPEEIGKFEFKRCKKIEGLLSGGNHTLVLADSTVYAWGDSNDGQIGRLPRSRNSLKHSLQIESTGLKKIVQIFTGKYHSFAKTDKGHILGWGLNNYGQLGDGTDESTHRPHNIPQLTQLDLSYIVGGENHSLGLTKNGELYAWGRNDDFQLGNKSMTNCFEPQFIEFSGNFTQIACGGHFNIAVTDNSNLYSWGYGDCYVLLNGKESSVAMPSLVAWSVGKGIQAVSAGAQHVVLIKQLVPFSFGAENNLKRKINDTSAQDKRKK